MSVDTFSEEYRHQCEVRQLLAWRRERGRDYVRDYIDGVVSVERGRMGGAAIQTVKRKGVRQQRGDAAADLLWADCRRQWDLGNDGGGDAWLS